MGNQWSPGVQCRSDVFSPTAAEEQLTFLHPERIEISVNLEWQPNSSSPFCPRERVHWGNQPKLIVSALRHILQLEHQRVGFRAPPTLFFMGNTTSSRTFHSGEGTKPPVSTPDLS